MKKNKIIRSISKNHLLEDDYQYLSDINGVRFTQREIDVISWVMSGKKGKTTASFFLISPRTLEAHTRNIMQKVKCNSREGIIDFVEKADRTDGFRNLYKKLILHAAFEKFLIDVKAIIGEKIYACAFDFIPNEKIIECIVSDLKLLNIIISDKSRTQNLSEFYNEKLSCNISFIERTELKIEALFPRSVTNVLFLNIDQNVKNESVENDLDYINFNNLNYYNSFSKMIAFLFRSDDFKRVVEKFNKENNISIKCTTEYENHNNSPQNESDFSHEKYFPYGPFFYASIKYSFCVFCFLLLAAIYNSYDSSANKTICSRLNVPKDVVLLKRQEIIKTIDKKLGEAKGIQTIALVGIGGAGKTTVARCYAHKQSADVVWEINAEKESTLVDSFESLAFTLTNNNEEKKVLKEIQRINNYKERTDRLISFVKNGLRNKKKWILIYDNMENFSKIQKMFPTDIKEWGNGKIIVTTRDNHIANHSQINHVLLIGELSEKEKFDLFQSIIKHGEATTSLMADKDYIRSFLRKIPPFPLDVSTAAYYIKATNIRCEEYMSRLNTHDVNFDDVQENIIRESTEYDKTRQKIIMLTLENLINLKKEFGEILLFICLVDSQDIPRDLLEKFKPSFMIDSFIYNLRKYSFITNESLYQAISCFSIHRSMQSVSLFCLIKIFSEKELEEILNKISICVFDYIKFVVNSECISKMRLMKNHSTVFLRNDFPLDEKIKGAIDGELGCINFYLGDYSEAINMLESRLKNMRKNTGIQKPEISKILSYLGMIYRELGDYRKAKDFLEKSLFTFKKDDISENYAANARILSYLGFTYRNLRDYDVASKTLNEALTIYREHLPDNYLGIARVLSYLGINCREQGDYIKARDLLEESLEIYRNKLPEDLTSIAKTLSLLGVVYGELGHYEKMRDLLEESIKTYKRYFPESHLELSINLMYLGNAYREIGDFQKAVELLKESISINYKFVNEYNTDLADALTYLGESYRELGFHKKARDLFEQSLKIFKENLSENHIDVAWVLALLGNAYKELGEYEKAETLVAEGIAILKRILPEDHIDIAWTLSILGDIYGYTKNYSAGYEIFEKVFMVYKRHFEFEKDHVKIGWLLLYAGNFYKNAGDYKKATDSFEAGLKIYRRYFGKNHVQVAKILRSLGEVYFLMERPNDCEKFVNEALEIFKKNKHPESCKCLEDLAEVFIVRAVAANKKHEIDRFNDCKGKSIDYLKKALEAMKKDYTSDSQHLKRVKTNLEVLLSNKKLS